MWFYEWAGPLFWLYAWGVVTLFSVFMALLFPIHCALVRSKLRWKQGVYGRISDFARRVGFKLDNIYVIHGSKRSDQSECLLYWFWT
ncbi:MAG: hypothetical protein V8S95_02825 [Odoribacter sp.]